MVLPQQVRTRVEAPDGAGRVREPVAVAESVALDCRLNDRFFAAGSVLVCAPVGWISRQPTYHPHARYAACPAQALTLLREQAAELVVVDSFLCRSAGAGFTERLMRVNPDGLLMVVDVERLRGTALTRGRRARRGTVVLRAGQEPPAERRDTPPAESRPTPLAVPLSPREREVLVGISEGRSNIEIGRQLYVSGDTVKTHVRRLFRKLGARDRAHAVAIAARYRLLFRGDVPRD